MKLFAIYLGGRASKCNTELHDVVFSCGNKIEDTYKDLLDKWFGLPDRLHIDSWVELKYVDGFEVVLSNDKPISKNKLFFINLGGYDKNKFEELHESRFFVGKDDKNIKLRAKQTLLLGFDQVHTDDIYDVDDCIEIKEVSGLYVNLIKSNKKENLEFNNGYLPIPNQVIKSYKKSIL